MCTRLCLYISRFGLSDQREIVPDVYSSLAFLYAARDSVYQISARLRQLCTACSPLFIELVTRSIRSVRDCASRVQLACLPSCGSRLGLSDQREIAPAVYSSLAVFTQLATRSIRSVRDCASCVQLDALVPGPADGHSTALCLPAVRGSSDG